jgi:hypothetical protein
LAERSVQAGKDPIEARDAARRADAGKPTFYPEFRAALAEVVTSKSLDARALGYWLRAVSGQIITINDASRYSFRSRSDPHTKIALWKLCCENHHPQRA